MTRSRPRLAAALLLVVPLAAAAQGGEPKWEAGVAAGAGYISDYPGSSQAHTRGLVAPVLIYRGPVLRVDERGVRGRLFDSPDVELDMALSAAFDARNNEAREGMPGLDYLFGIGPQLVYRGLCGVPGQPSLRVKARALFSTDFRKLDSRGLTLDTELRWRWRPRAGDPASTLGFALQPTWASRSLQSYFYEVDVSQATPVRPAYRARSGYLGTELNLTWQRRVDPELSWFVTLRSMSLHGAANSDSPLHRRSTSASVGAGVIWTPWRSESRAAD